MSKEKRSFANEMRRMRNEIKNMKEWVDDGRDSLLVFAEGNWKEYKSFETQGSLRWDERLKLWNF